MLTYVSGNLFESPAQVLVNTINIVGVMGKGIAKKFKDIYPEMFEQYQALCENNKLNIGQLWLYKTPNKWVLNFPTKIHWRNPSKVEYIEAGLMKFIENYSKWGIHSIAFPPLGCGNGELDFGSQVKPLMESYLKNLPMYSFIYPGKKEEGIPEHRNQKEMKDWLNSQPESLSFNEVWDDIEKQLKLNGHYYTHSTKAKFQAKIDEDSKNKIKIITKSKKEFYLYREQLLDLWQQIRNFGYSNRKIIPNGLGKSISYILPLFSKLEYLKIVELSDSYSDFSKNPSIGIQFIGKKKQDPIQLELFSNL
jgi:O-acetyl-ADP-ribose deacetylase (regulator of RNase III)